MKYPVIFLIALLFTGFHASAQSGSRIDPEIPAMPPNDSVRTVVIELEVTINSISLLKISSNNTRTANDKVFAKGSMVNILSSTHAKHTYYQLNKAPEQRYDQPFRLVGKGRNTLTVRAIDDQGRESSLTLSFRVVD